MGSFTFMTDASRASKVVAGPGIILLALAVPAPACRPSPSSSPAPTPSVVGGNTAAPGRAHRYGGAAQLRRRLRPPLPGNLSAAREEERGRARSLPARRRGRGGSPEPGRRDPSDRGGTPEAGGDSVEDAATAADEL